MIISSGNKKYKWIEDWVKIPKNKIGPVNGRTHGIVLTEGGTLLFLIKQIQQFLYIT